MAAQVFVPSNDYVPCGQTSQSIADIAAVLFENKPAGQA